MAKTKVVGVRLPHEMLERLAAAAKANGLTVSMQARVLLTAALRNGKEAQA
jgi:antitoxin component of RelBE/YafQ-DinJ toxin-antitoxin module